MDWRAIETDDGLAMAFERARLAAMPAAPGARRGTPPRGWSRYLALPLAAAALAVLAAVAAAIWAADRAGLSGP